MRKLKLELGDLKVESFAPMSVAGRIGTVRAKENSVDYCTDPQDECKYTGYPTGECDCPSQDVWCGSTDCPNTGIFECDNYSRLEPEACPANTNPNCTANGCWSGNC